MGDIKAITLTSSDTNISGTYIVRIANKSNTGEVCINEKNIDGEIYSKTACGFVIEFADIITITRMNAAQTNVGGWPSSSMRSYVNNDIYNALPINLKNEIIDTIVVSGHGSTSGETNFISTDKLYLLSTIEVKTPGGNYDTAKDVTRQLDYYKEYKSEDGSIGVTTDNYSGAIKKLNGSARPWWLRSARSDSTDYFSRVLDDGGWSSYYARITSGVAPSFRIG